MPVAGLSGHDRHLRYLYLSWLIGLLGCHAVERADFPRHQLLQMPQIAVADAVLFEMHYGVAEKT